MEASNKSIDILLAECEKEPIHIPGSIQPFGILLTVDPDSLRIQNASENCLGFWGISARDLVGKSFADLLAGDDAAHLRQYIIHPHLKEQSFLPLDLPADQGTTRQAWHLNAHKQRDTLFLEMEPAVAHDIQSPAVPFHRKIREAVQSLQSAKSLQALCEAAVTEVRAISGFDRVMLYRFDAEFNGMVIAEATNPAVESYLGHHFPASDIPSQARAIFLQNWLRMIPDVAYTPSPLYPGIDPLTHAPLDLSQATLRSVSPLHLEYLTNMHVRATLTISILDEGKLWGLIACHHETPLLIDAEDRLGAQLIGQIVSSQIRTKEALGDAEYKVKLERIHAALITHMQEDDDLLQGMVKYSTDLLDIAAALGAAAAIYSDDNWTLIGKTPSIAQIDALATWLSATHPNEALFQTDSLSRLYPAASEYREIASGLLAIMIPRTTRNYLLWFRPEQLTTVVWAGNPQKSVRQTSDSLRLHPRASFKSWEEIVTGKAVPWKKVEVDAVDGLRNTITALDLSRQFKKEQTARADAERLTLEKEYIVTVVSHDLKTPLSVANLVLEVLQRSPLNTHPTLADMIKKGINATREMERLIVDLLDIAKIESGTLELNDRVQDIAQLAAEIVDMTSPIAKEKGIQLIAIPAAEKCMASCDRGRVFQALSNLVGNALKFTPAGGRITVSIDSLDDEAIFCVADSGRGIAEKDIENIFDRFWQAKEAKRLGTGLGLSITKDIVEKHGGRIWIESEIGVGTNFYFSLPKKPKA